MNSVPEKLDVHSIRGAMLKRSLYFLLIGWLMGVSPASGQSINLDQGFTPQSHVPPLNVSRLPAPTEDKSGVLPSYDSLDSTYGDRDLWFQSASRPAPVVDQGWHPALSDIVLTRQQLRAYSTNRISWKPARTVDGSKIQLVAYQEDEAAEKNQKAETGSNAGPASPEDESEKQIVELKQQIESRRKQVAENESLDAASKADANNQLALASGRLEKAETARKYIETETKNLDSFNDRFQKLTEELKQTVDPALPKINTKLEQLETELTAKESDLKNLEDELKKNRGEKNDLEKRVGSLPTDRDSVETDFRKTENDIAELEKQPEDSNRDFGLIVLRSKRVQEKLEIKKLALESQRLEQKVKLLPLKEKQLSQQIGVLEEEIKTWKDRVTSQRNVQIEKQQEQLDKTAEIAKLFDNSVLQKMAERGKELAIQRGDYNTKTESLGTELTGLEKQNDDIEEARETLKTKIETIGLTTSTGMLLVDHRRNLAPTSISRRRLSELADNLRKSQAEVLHLNEEQETLDNDEEQIELILAAKDYKDDDILKIKLAAKKAIESQSKLIDDLLGDIGTYQRKIFDVEVEHRSLVTNIESSKEFIQENALWVRSAENFELKDVSGSAKGMRLFLDQTKWAGIIDAVQQHVVNRPYELGILGFVFVGLIVVQRRLRWSHE